MTQPNHAGEIWQNPADPSQVLIVRATYQDCWGQVVAAYDSGTHREYPPEVVIDGVAQSWTLVGTA